MASLPPRSAPTIAAAPSATPPSARRLRAEAVHRLQLGLFGLCAMLLIVGLANIIMDRARLAGAADPPSATLAAAKADKPASDPLADIGVVPASDPSGSASGARHAR